MGEHLYVFRADAVTLIEEGDDPPYLGTWGHWRTYRVDFTVPDMSAHASWIFNPVSDQSTWYSLDLLYTRTGAVRWLAPSAALMGANGPGSIGFVFANSTQQQRFQMHPPHDWPFHSYEKYPPPGHSVWEVVNSPLVLAVYSNGMTDVPGIDPIYLRGVGGGGSLSLLHRTISSRDVVFPEATDLEVTDAMASIRLYDGVVPPAAEGRALSSAVWGTVVVSGAVSSNLANGKRGLSIWVNRSGHVAGTPWAGYNLLDIDDGSEFGLVFHDSARLVLTYIRNGNHYYRVNDQLGAQEGWSGEASWTGNTGALNSGRDEVQRWRVRTD